MKLLEIHVQNFKSVLDSGEFTVQQVTSLVGKNEAGKSALLQALYRLNPINAQDGNYDVDEDYPRSRLQEYQEDRERDTVPPAVVLTTSWELEDQDREALAKLVGSDAIQTISQVTATKGYDTCVQWTVELDEQIIVNHYIQAAGLYEEERAALAECELVDEVLDALADLQDPLSPNQSRLQQALTNAFPDGVEPAVANALTERLPKFLYFASYDRLPGRVSIDQLLSRISQNQTSPSDRLFLALLDHAGTTPAALQNLTTSERLIARLEGVSNRISSQIFRYWSQNKHLEVQFQLLPGRPEDPPEFRSGNIFHIRIRNSRHQVTVRFDERSTGFVWFFSFLVWFSQLQHNYDADLFVLLDEPGLGLHAKAQEDLLRYINEQLRPHYQVIYSTHSPWMIDPENLLSARTVEDVMTKAGDILGTKVGDRVLSTDADTLQPLQGAIGYGLTQTLFIGKYNLLVEGPSDLLYLKWFSGELKRQQRTSLDRRWTIVPSEGLSKIRTFATLFRGHQLAVAVLADFHHGEKREVERLRASHILKQSHVLSADTYAGQTEADVEDIIGREFYVALVNACYGLTAKQRLPAKKPAAAPARVVAEVEQYLALLPPVIPEFDHYAPAVYLTEHGAEFRHDALQPGLVDALTRFEQLFQDLNSLLPAQK